MNKKLILAFSGGLDTSFCSIYLKHEKNYEVHSAIVQTGGFSDEELAQIEKKAYSLGVASHKTIDVTDVYYQQCIRYMVYGNVLKNNTYPLSVSSERAFQAIALAEYAKETGAAYIAHGSTGAGNDQIRFDMIFQIIAPEIEIITPIRDLKLSREQEISYLKEKGVQSDWTKSKYSINKGIWGTSVGGVETLSSNTPLPDDAYPTPLSKEKPETITLTFEKGELKGIGNTAYDNPAQAIVALEKIAGPYAIGRDIHVGDTIIGIKGRVGFEAASPLITIKAHHALEKHVLTKWQQYWKQQLGEWYGMLLHEGQFMEPVMRDIEQFLESTQANVTGKVHVLLQPYHFSVQGIESDFDLMNSGFAHYGEMNNAWTGDDVKGFTKLLSNQMKIYQHVQNKAK